MKKRSLLHTTQKKQLYRINGVQKLMPFYEHGYNKTGGGHPDPNSERQKRLHRAKNGPPGGLPNTKPHPPSKAPGQQVKENSHPSIIGEKICVLDGSNLRPLRDGLGLCSPGVIPQENRPPKPFWETVKRISFHHL